MASSFIKNTLFGKCTTTATSSTKGYLPLTDSEHSPRLAYHPCRYSCFHDGAEDEESALADSSLESEKQRQAGSGRDPAPAKSSFHVDARVISDAIIGLSDGLTVPFALTAGLSALGNTKVVIYGGLAELIAGSISMGLGGYLGAKSEEESYRATVAQTKEDIVEQPDAVRETVFSLLASYDLPETLATELTEHLSGSPKALDFLIRFEHSLPEPPATRAFTCALTIALGYFIGGFVPLLPYFFVATHAVDCGLVWSAGTMAIALFLFGFGKTGIVNGWKGWSKGLKNVRGGVEMVVVGSVAAAAAMGLVYAFNQGR
ncbi:uncharacterized protein K452DRAFT_350899 [Aplosporella prunicola CBS 121167]|uniref:Uncharacterized protein n=1 Tax=Aplosporella prunicola CBS 121167 TaxID=1176127 RepID=A0A6A6BGN2_9PEZI|nr:uncharacterized protein K452DRAFT_350899 [Aplosporella prunicola CBS 121167]KAF2142583.1 hypothetical protein K452DRAFT_350899 [Aplosporella prunicola CBS 121167]